jgi:hypothetical protein
MIRLTRLFNNRKFFTRCEKIFAILSEKKTSKSRSCHKSSCSQLINISKKVVKARNFFVVFLSALIIFVRQLKPATRVADVKNIVS